MATSGRCQRSEPVLCPRRPSPAGEPTRRNHSAGNRLTITLSARPKPARQVSRDAPASPSPAGKPTCRDTCYKSGRGQVRSLEIRAASMGLFCACSAWTNHTLSPGFFPKRLSTPDAPMALRSRDRSIKPVDGFLLSHWNLRVAICKEPIFPNAAVSGPTQ